MPKDLDPEAMAVAYDAIRDSEFNGIPATKLASALMKASVNLTNDGYDTLGGTFDPGPWEQIRTGETTERYGECPVCDWQHSWIEINPADSAPFGFCPRDGATTERATEVNDAE